MAAGANCHRARGADARVAAMVVLGVSPRDALPMLYFMLAYAAGGLTECLYYFFRGLDRTDLESTFTLRAARRHVRAGRRLAVVASGRGAARRAMLVPALATLVAAGYAAWRLASGMDVTISPTASPLRREFFQSVAPIGRHHALGPLFQDRRLPAGAMERNNGSGAL